ncbi:LysR family transcriptional regulator [Ramlibacter albus]|uniref:LysR family transcriptional regulator n=1 Tax=Ramlibacter albus TaxID=2079448 RepID=A0A923M905_9BURK|nr:LysR family transcriptional regulator [Ramlibacter albus]MBC5766230.1 LysR family transcriptional regulator [Ramlibacter albus]
MDLHAHLAAFCSVAEHGSLTRSAAALGVATSALSRQLAALEHEAQARLFHRTGRGVVLTDLGRRVLPRAKSLLAEADALMAELRGEYASPSGTVDIGVVPAVRPLVAQLCARLQKEYPRIRLRAHEGFSGQVEEWVTAGRLDFGLFNRYGRGSVRGADALLRSPMVVVGRKGLPVLKAKEVSFRQLADVPMAIPIRPNALLAAIEAAAQRYKLEMKFVFESGSEAIIMDSIANAGLCTVVPQHVAVRDYGAARFSWATLVEPRMTQVTWMAQTNARPVTPASRIVAQLARELAPALASAETGQSRLGR